MELIAARAPAYLVFDIETTGTRLGVDHILEIGGIAVDENLKEISRFERIINPGVGGVLELMRESKLPDGSTVFDMHTKSRLIHELYSLRLGQYIGDVQSSFVEWLRRLGYSESEKIVMAGNSVAFDITFTKHHLKDVAKLLSHRSVDISATRRLLNSPAFGKWGFADAADVPHRSMEDCEVELKEFRDMARACSIVSPGGAHG